MENRQWAVREERLLTQIIVRLLKAWKVTVVGKSVTMPLFSIISRRSTSEIVLSRE